MRKWLNVALLAAVLMGFVGCSDEPKDDGKITTALPVVALKSVGNTTLVIESAFPSGNYGLIVSGKYYSKKTISGDADVGFADGNFYILERWGPDNLVFLTADGEIIQQIPFESPAFNAHGICGNGNGKIFVGSYENLTIAVFEKENGGINYKRSIDLPQFPNAQLQDLKFANGKIYAALQFLEDWLPSANSKILEIDETGNVLREFESNFMNVIEIAVRGNYLFVLDRGSYYETNGGITEINLTNGAKTTILDGSAVGASPQKIEFISDNEAFLLMDKGWAAMEHLGSYIAKIALNDNSFRPFDDVRHSISAISYNEATGTLWAASGNEVFKY